MEKKLKDYLEKIPYEVGFRDIPDFESFEERFFDVSGLFGSIMSMNVDSTEFCPNTDPPDLTLEILPYLWAINPKLDKEILTMANDDLKELIQEDRKYRRYLRNRDA